MAAAVVFQASSQLKKTCDRYRHREFTGRQQLWQAAWEQGMLGDFSLEEVVSKDEGSDIWRETV